MSRAVTLCFVLLAAAVTVRAEHTQGSTTPNTPKRIEYRMDVAAIPGPGGLAGLRVGIKNSADAGVVRKFEVVDDKPFHLFIVGRDLRFFRHLYPTLLPDGSLEAREQIPAGEYLVAADFLPSGGSRQFLQQIVSLSGNVRGDSRGSRSAARSAPGSPGGVYDIVTNVRIQPLPAALTSGQRTAFHVMLSRTEDGRPLVNLEPYLGGAGYLLAVREDLSEVVRAQAPPAGLPVSLLTFDMTFPKAGAYVVWVEFQRFGEPLTARLEVTAR